MGNGELEELDCVARCVMVMPNWTWKAERGLMIDPLKRKEDDKLNCANKLTQHDFILPMTAVKDAKKSVSPSKDIEL
ncbi:hypothetical protein Pint_12570 [Pistacia integerrima]|uniref:Uncharacterized protein n=1 Tax=Pistacia integerrima TaxID=434235 RepID=A0ACC0Y696_9ROSI|nr:hypothetical protein Pint_12570 [Pistacia integerrima]